MSKNSRKASNRKSRRTTNDELREFMIDAQEQRDQEKRNQLDFDLSTIRINREIKCKNQKQKELLKTIKANEITFVRGAAGTGKTLISLRAALEMLKKDDNEFHKILLTKPIIEAQDNRLGFLPGGIDEKIDPYMDSYMTNFNLLLHKGQTSYLNTAGVIEVNPLPYMRGNTFMNSIAIMDEAQNVTVGGMKLFLSRKHETCKLIILGDDDQTDLKMRGHEKNGLRDAFERFEGIDGVGFVTFTEEDIVRSSILIELMKRYKQD